MNFLAAPLVVPLATAAACVAFSSNRRVQRGLSVTGSLGLLVVASALLAAVLRGGTQRLAVGGWPVPFGIELAADLTSALLVVAASIVGLAVTTHALGSIDARREGFGFHALVHVLLMGVCGAFLTGDLFNLFVWFEVLLISSFVLLALGAEKPQLAAALKYVAINLVASSIFLVALGLLYGALGTLNMADLAARLSRSENPGFAAPLAMMFLVSFGIKAGLFPLHFWLPASYHTPPPVVGALFAGLLTKVGVYALLRTFSLIFVSYPLPHIVLLWLSGITMIVGGLGAIVQTDLRRLLAYNVLVGVGAMVLGVGLNTAASLSGTLMYMLQSALTSTAAFLVAGAVREVAQTDDLTKMGGLAAERPRLSAAFLLVGFALAGVPPLTGFFGKSSVLMATLQEGQYALATAVVVSSLLTLASILRAWNLAFWRPGTATEGRRIYGVRLPTAAILVAMLAFTVAAGPIMAAVNQAGRLLLPQEGRPQ